MLNVPICTQGMQRTWWPEASTIIVTGPFSQSIFDHMILRTVNIDKIEKLIEVILIEWMNSDLIKSDLNFALFLHETVFRYNHLFVYNRMNSC